MPTPLASTPRTCPRGPGRRGPPGPVRAGPLTTPWGPGMTSRMPPRSPISGVRCGVGSVGSPLLCSPPPHAPHPSHFTDHREHHGDAHPAKRGGGPPRQAPLLPGHGQRSARRGPHRNPLALPPRQAQHDHGRRRAQQDRGVLLPPAQAHPRRLQGAGALCRPVGQGPRPRGRRLHEKLFNRLFGNRVPPPAPGGQGAAGPGPAGGAGRGGGRAVRPAERGLGAPLAGSAGIHQAPHARGGPGRRRKRDPRHRHRRHRKHRLTFSPTPTASRPAPVGAGPGLCPGALL